MGGATSLNADRLGISMTGPHLVLSLAGLCSLVGLGRIARRYGDAGLVGVVAGAGVVVIIVSKNLPSSVSDDTGWAIFYAGGLLLLVGLLLLGAVASRAGEWNFGGPLLAAGGLVIVQVALLMFTETGFLATLVLPILVGIAWITIGYALWTHRTEPVREPAHSVG
ncbi:MAG TPA: hypothetical protein VFJ83_02615 [Nocardioidaceae bacterium]|nr:hypothetical protein [Nocardioidaceae bacterium]